MTPNDASIEAIIDQLESLTSAETGYFAMQQCGGGPDESIIRANKDGLRLYATELLKASLGKEHCIGESEISWLSAESDVWMMNVELTQESQVEKLGSLNQGVNETTFPD